MTTASKPKVHCEECNKDYLSTSIGSHRKTALHLSNVGKAIKEPTNENTAKIVNNGKKYFEDIKDYVEPQILYNLLKEQNLADSTIELNIRMGYLRDRARDFTKKQVNTYNIFLRDLKDKINTEALDNNSDILPILENFKNNDMVPARIRLYLYLPFRVDSWANTTITDSEEEGRNTINYKTGKVSLYNGKTSSHDEFMIDEETRNFLTKHPELYNESLTSTVRTFNRELHKYINSNSILIRRAFAEQTPNRIYGARVLQHSASTHRGLYIRK